MYLELSKKQFLETFNQFMDEEFQTTEEFEKFTRKVILQYLKWPGSDLEILLKSLPKSKVRSVISVTGLHL